MHNTSALRFALPAMLLGLALTASPPALAEKPDRDDRHGGKHDKYQKQDKRDKHGPSHRDERRDDHRPREVVRRRRRACR
ncbi:hypothetical protein [Hydrogenophaga sp. BPS33]|uniref:hypothetical protein n=1 Tax=Hydrogenophaga sp. BPS33 TaxID=2651974 RepID=UPI00131FC44A|nr:hypothetical protein [Hydrogenophaga sp. BPS33]QHE88312.1 hypothetical protein F9K07_27240 [Hydrogenophaga sp. BPS33]